VAKCSQPTDPPTTALSKVASDKFLLEFSAAFGASRDIIQPREVVPARRTDPTAPS
jgi:hypothetical protein